MGGDQTTRRRFGIGIAAITTTGLAGCNALGSGGDADDVEDEAADEQTEIRLVNSDDEVYQTGRVLEGPDSVAPGDDISVTGEVTAEIDDAEGNVTYAVLGLDDGTVLDVGQPSDGSEGEVTHEATIPQEASGTTLVWTFRAVFSASDAREGFRNLAENDRLAAGDKGLTVAEVSGSAGGDDGDGTGI